MEADSYAVLLLVWTVLDIELPVPKAAVDGVVALTVDVETNSCVGVVFVVSGFDVELLISKAVCDEVAL